jgi:hypothetical protein
LASAPNIAGRRFSETFDACKLETRLGFGPDAQMRPCGRHPLTCNIRPGGIRIQ